MCYLCCSVIDVVNPRFSLCNPTSLATFVYESVAFTVDHVSSSLSLHHLFKHMPTSQHGEYKFMESYGQWSIALCFWHWELPVSSTTGKLSVRLAQMDHSLKYSWARSRPVTKPKKNKTERALCVFPCGHSYRPSLGRSQNQLRVGAWYITLSLIFEPASRLNLLNFLLSANKGNLWKCILLIRLKFEKRSGRQL